MYSSGGSCLSGLVFISNARLFRILKVSTCLACALWAVWAAAQSPQKRQSAADPLQQHYDAARTFGLAGDVQRAAEESKAFLLLALGRIAAEQMRSEEYKASIRSLDDALTLEPRNTGLLANRAALLVRQNKLDEAKSAAEAALQVSPNDPDILSLLGNILFQKGDYAGAKKYLEQSVASKANMQTGYQLGITYLKLKDINHARLLFDEMLAGLGDTVQLRILIGRAYRDAEYWNESIEELKKAIAKHPKATQAHYFLGLAYLGRDNDSGLPEAIPEFRAELQVNPNDYRSHYMLGYGLLKQHDLAGAEAEFTRASTIEPENRDPWIYLAQLYAEADRKSEAEQAARKAIALTKDESANEYQISQAHYLLARILMDSGKREEGVKELTKSEELRKQRLQRQVARQNPTDTASIAEQAGHIEEHASTVSPEVKKQAEQYINQLKPAVADAYNNMGVAAAGQKDFASALNYFEKAAYWNPTLAKLNRNQGMAAFYASAFDKAVPPLFRELQDHPDDLRVRAALGLSYFSLENYKATLETLRSIEPQVNEDPGLGAAYAVSLIKTGSYEQGMSRLKLLAVAHVDSPEIHQFLGNTYADQGIYASAIEEYRKSLTLDSSQQRTHFLLGLALIRQGSTADAVPELRTALKLNPADVSAKYHLAFSLAQTGEKAEALTLLQQVIEQDKNYSDAYYQLGKLQLEQGDTKAAIPSLETASRLSPESDYVHYQLALAYRRDARNEDAEREMQQYQGLKSRRRGNHEQPQSN